MAQRDIKRARAIVSDDSDSSDSTVIANAPSGPRYLYYRLFTENMGIPSEKPAFPSDPYLGRVRANSVAPPQTVHLIKRRLCQIEDISDYLSSVLFLSSSSLSPMSDTERVSILTPSGPGSTPDKSMELVVNLSHRDRGWSNNSAANRQAMSPKPQYIYYSPYTEAGEIRAAYPVNPDAEDSPSIARIDNNLVPPPHTVDSVIRCISFVEGFPYSFWHRLFVDITHESPIGNISATRLTLTNGGPGSMPERPLTFVQAAELKERRSILSPRSYGAGSGFLSVNKYDGIYIDGVVRREESTIYKSELRSYHSVYRARNAAGQEGFVNTNNVSVS
ncbi:hypothetical protein PILCRDRAFT_826886 [Piloderma croceum F 1598]|uniref:Uncharacterized protein n=1 Tax=Piloderma croceum (strain F 1598) TaxID=765440 RepID=A0A0C3ETJ7_PILCF|nr:hypothetical protein PILCRDRAFT_826886 [Piloderma croceum F 1598]